MPVLLELVGLFAWRLNSMRLHCNLQPVSAYFFSRYVGRVSIKLSKLKYFIDLVASTSPNALLSIAEGALWNCTLHVNSQQPRFPALFFTGISCLHGGLINNGFPVMSCPIYVCQKKAVLSCL